MKRLTFAIAGLVLTLAVLASTGVISTPTATAEPARAAGHSHSFERFLQRYEAANSAFVNGNSVAVVVDHRREGPGFDLRRVRRSGRSRHRERPPALPGRGQRLRPSGAWVDFEYRVKDVRGSLAYTVAIERANVLYAGHTERQPQILRATMIFRFEKGAWKIVHRHADTMVDLQLPTPR